VLRLRCASGEMQRNAAAGRQGKLRIAAQDWPCLAAVITASLLLAYQN